LAKAGKARAKANGFDVPILHNSAGAHGGLLHRLMGMQGRVGLMLESPMDVDPAVREPLYTAFVSGVVDAMGKEQWRRARR